GWNAPNPIIGQTSNLVATAESFYYGTRVTIPSNTGEPGPVWIIQSCMPLASTEISKLAPPVKESVPVQSGFMVYVPRDPLEWRIVPLMLTVAYGLTSVPSPLKLIPSTMAFGCAIPPTMFHPCAVNTYEPRRVYSPQPSARLSASAVSDAPSAIAATRLTNAHTNRKVPIKLIT